MQGRAEGCVGIDGAGSGWLAVWLPHADAAFAWALYPTVASAAGQLAAAKVVAIDIPMGLAEHGPRAAEREARRFVGGRRACSVFPAPLRGILGAGSQAEASRLHRQLDERGRGFGAQAFALLPKVAAWDAALRADPALAARSYEVHPEVSFAAMNAGVGLAAGKKTAPGHAQRRELLARRYGEARVAALLDRVGRREAAPDDVLDALAACWSAARIERGVALTLPSPVPRDAHGLRMAIHC